MSPAASELGSGAAGGCVPQPWSNTETDTIRNGFARKDLIAVPFLTIDTRSARPRSGEVRDDSAGRESTAFGRVEALLYWVGYGIRRIASTAAQADLRSEIRLPARVGCYRCSRFWRRRRACLPSAPSGLMATALW